MRPKLGAYLVRHALVPSRVIVSGAQRTRETWERLAVVLPTAPPVSYDDRLYNAGMEQIYAVIVENPAPTVMVIGHNPGLHDIAQHLIATGDGEAREATRRRPAHHGTGRNGLCRSGLAHAETAQRAANGSSLRTAQGQRGLAMRQTSR